MSADCALLNGVWVRRSHSQVIVDAERYVWLCFVLRSSRSPRLIPSSSLDPNLLSPPTSTPVPPSVFYSQSTPNHPVTPPPNAFIPTTTPISNKTSGNY